MMTQTMTPTAGIAAVGRLRPRFDGVRRIAVLRGGGLGDLLFTMPAMQAFAAAYPEAEVTVLGSGLAHELLARRTDAPHRVRVLPAVPGVGAALDAVVDEGRIARFLADRREERIDLAVQLHGGGRFSNPFLRAMGARHTIGSRTPDAAELDRSLDYVYYQHEVLRGLEVAGLAGAAPVSLEPRLAITATERAAGRAALGEGGPTVVVHPGARDPRRRWPIDRFVAVAAGLVREGARVVFVGAGEDEDLGRHGALATREAVGSARSGRVLDASGRLSLPAFAGALAEADAVLANDSGPRHLAQAVGTRTVSIYWFGNVVNAAPLDRGRHRVHIGWTTRCPVCGRDCTQVGWNAARCEHDPSFVADVPVDPVREDIIRFLTAAASSSVAANDGVATAQGQDGSSSGATTSSRTSTP